MARPTSRHNRFSSLWVSRSILKGASWAAPASVSVHTALMVQLAFKILCGNKQPFREHHGGEPSFAPEDFDADRGAVGVHVGLGRGYARRLHLGMQEHLRENVVA